VVSSRNIKWAGHVAPIRKMRGEKEIAVARLPKSDCVEDLEVKYRVGNIKL
jgi:hypothetical protein